MAETESKSTQVGLEPSYSHSSAEVPRPGGWMYRSFNIGKWTTSWYASPRVQLGMVAFVCFMCPGMFNALSGLGGGGKTDNTLADNMVSFAPGITVSGLSNSLLVEYRTLQYFRRRRIFRWNSRQSYWSASCAVIWWRGILHLLDQSSRFRACRCRGLQHLCWCIARCLCGSAVVGAGHYHDVLSQ